MRGKALKSAAFAFVIALVGASSPGFAQDTQAPVPGLKLSGDQPIQIESDKLEVNESKSMATFTGNVSVVQGATLLKSGRMVVYYKPDATTGRPSANGSAAIDRLEVDGKVYVKSGTQVGTGDRGTFDMDSNVLTLSGKEVVLSDGSNVMKGCKLTVQMSTGQSNVDRCGEGRVQVLITPGAQNQNQ